MRNCVVLGTKAKLYGRGWLVNSHNRFSFTVTLDGQIVNLEEVVLNNNGTFALELPLFKEPKQHELKVFQYNVEGEKSERKIIFNAVVVDQENSHNPRER